MIDYPCFCKVWDISLGELEVYFTIIVGKPTRYVDHNGCFWDCAVPITIEEFNNPVKSLVDLKAYSHLTEQPEELERNIAKDLLRGCQNCED